MRMRDLGRSGRGYYQTISKTPLERRVRVIERKTYHVISSVPIPKINWDNEIVERAS